MDQKAKDNGGSGLSWHLGRGLAIHSLRLFRGFHGRMVRPCGFGIWKISSIRAKTKTLVATFYSVCVFVFFCVLYVVDV